MIANKPSMYLRRMHRISCFPTNVFTLGDAFCSLNPVFGQGMTLALEQALLLQKGLQRLGYSSHEFHRKSAERTRLPFLLSKLGANIENGISQKYLQRYLQSFLRRCQSSTQLHKSFLRVLHLKASYGSLLDPLSLIASLNTGETHD